jgi:hypothetical protein
MTISELKDYLTAMVSHVLFEYNGRSCGIDPLSFNIFEMWIGEEYMTARSVEEVLSVKFFDGKSVKEIWDDVTELEY